MPNHLHFIVVNLGLDNVGSFRPDGNQTGEGRNGGGNQTGEGEHTGSPLRTVVQWFKTMTTNEYICGVKQQGWPRFAGKLWQRNYWEHVVRNESNLTHIRQYIANNPQQWTADRLHFSSTTIHESPEPYLAAPWMV